MIFNVMDSGGMTVTMTIPIVTISSSGISTDGFNPDPLTATYPLPTAQYGSVLPSGSGTIYHMAMLLHLQFGANPLNTLMDVSQTVSFVSTIATESTPTGTVSYTSTLSTGTNTLTASVLPNQLVGSAVIDGIYALGYLGIGFTDPIGISGTVWYLYDYGTNTTVFQPSAPSATGPLVITADANYENYTFTWLHSIPGSAPIAGYRLSWGSDPSGPYPNSLDLPINAYPLGTTSSYIFTAPVSTFGSGNYFTVNAFDDGSNPPNSGVTPPQLINYIPPNIAV